MRAFSLLSLPLLIGMGGCTMVGNPMFESGTWHPTGANAANLAAMVANPEDLARGRSTADVPGAIVVMPVEALRRDKVKKLPPDTMNPIGNGGGSSGASGP